MERSNHNQLVSRHGKPGTHIETEDANLMLLFSARGVHAIRRIFALGGVASEGWELELPLPCPGPVTEALQARVAALQDKWSLSQLASVKA